MLNTSRPSGTNPAAKRSARNIVRSKGKPLTLSQLVDHYSQRELSPNCRWKTHSTKLGYRGYLRKWIIPRWGDHRLKHIRLGEIELWLRSLPLARSSCAKIRNVMSVLFNHGLRHELVDRNPVQWVRQSTKRNKIPAVLEIAEVQSLLAQNVSGELTEAQRRRSPARDSAEI